MYSMLENFHNFSLANVSILATRHFTHRVYLNILCDSNSRDHILKFLQPQKISPLNESTVPFSAIGLMCGKVNILRSTIVVVIVVGISLLFV
jgi:hypothetical protein